MFWIPNIMGDPGNRGPCEWRTLGVVNPGSGGRNQSETIKLTSNRSLSKRYKVVAALLPFVLSFTHQITYLNKLHFFLFFLSFPHQVAYVSRLHLFPFGC